MTADIAKVDQLLARQPRFPLATVPTPLDPLLAQLPGRHGRIFVKRDDCTGLALGGNKTRKLEYTLGHARSRGATALFTASGIQSNHVRQTAAAAARAGLPFHAVVAPALPRFPRAHLESGNMLLDMLFGAELHLVEDETLAEAEMTCIAEALSAAGGRPYIIPLGASDGIGSLGYVRCAIELLDQVQMQGLDISHLFVATGSGGTHGGLLAGLRLAGSDMAVIGISVSEPSPLKQAKVRASIEGVAETLGVDLSIGDTDIVVHDAYAGAGYSHPTEAANDWVCAIARSDGLLLDPVYTGKAFAGMADLLGSDRLGEVRDVVFLHTGGAPALFADPRLLRTPEADAPGMAALYGAVTD